MLLTLRISQICPASLSAFTPITLDQTTGIFCLDLTDYCNNFLPFSLFLLLPSILIMFHPAARGIIKNWKLNHVTFFFKLEFSGQIFTFSSNICSIGYSFQFKNSSEKNKGRGILICIRCLYKRDFIHIMMHTLHNCPIVGHNYCPRFTDESQVQGGCRTLPWELPAQHPLLLETTSP